MENDLTVALKICESLRNESDVRFVTMAIENPDQVGKMGVSDKLPDGYDWKKRRDSLTIRRKESKLK
jgi:hypothetical protein